MILTAANTYTGGTSVNSGGGARDTDYNRRLARLGHQRQVLDRQRATLAVSDAVTDANVTTILGTGNFGPAAGLGFDTTSGDRTYAATLGGGDGNDQAWRAR